MVKAPAVLDRLDAIGVNVTIDGQKLLLRPGSRVPPDLVEELRQRKLEVLAYLRRMSAQDSFEPWVLREWRWVSIPQWQDVLRESIAQGDKEREGYARWILAEVLLAEGEECAGGY